jgi:hypothetical protein
VLRSNQRIGYLFFCATVVATLVWTVAATSHRPGRGLGLTAGASAKSLILSSLTDIGAVNVPILINDVLGSEQGAAGVGVLFKRFSAEKWTAIKFAAEESVAVSPLNSKMWLVLAISQMELHSPGSFLGALKMSYYTAPNSATMEEPRLSLALQEEALWDSELRNVVRRRIRNMLTGPRELRLTLARVYCRSSPQGRAVISDVARDVENASMEINPRAC